MFRNLKCFLPLFILVTVAATPALAAYSPTTPPPGWSVNPKGWAKQFARSDKAAQVAAKLVKGASAECIRAVFLKNFIDTHAVSALEGTEESYLYGINKADAAKVRQQAQREQDDSCNGPSNGNPGATVQAVVQYMEDGSPSMDAGAMREAVAAAYGYARPKAKPDDSWVLYLFKAGVLVQQAAEGAAARAAGMMPILNPELFGPRRAQPTSL